MARMFVIPARDEPVAVILRRGPSRWYHVILWDTRRDTFTRGAWIKARIYEDKCDLSPDGRLFVYFVHQGSRGGTPYTHAWTAVSRPPWLQALAVWPQRTTYGGGGRFVGPRQLALRGVWHDSATRTRDGSLDRSAVTSLELVDGPTDLHRSSGEVSDADWSGRDQRGRLVYTAGTRLLARGRRTDELLADFTDSEPEPQPAPEWATRPL